MPVRFPFAAVWLRGLAVVLPGFISGGALAVAVPAVSAVPGAPAMSRASPRVRTGLELLEKQVREFTLANGLR